MSIPSNIIKARNRLFSIFDSFTISEKDLFTDRLQKWCKTYEDIDIKIEIDKFFDDIIAYLEVDLKSKNFVRLVGIKIGRSLFETLDRHELAAGFLIELEVYKKFYKSDLLKLSFYSGITYSNTSLIIASISTIIAAIEPIPVIAKYIIASLLLVVLIKLLFLTVSWLIISNKEYVLNKKYGLVKETAGFYEHHKRIIVSKSDYLATKTKIATAVTNIFNENPIFGNQANLCRFLKDIIKDETIDDEISDEALQIYKQTCTISNKEAETNLRKIKTVYEKSKSLILTGESA